MSRENLEDTLFNLRAAINTVRCQGKTVDKIIIGIELIHKISSYTNLLANSVSVNKLWGIPYEVNYTDGYCLEVATVYKVNVERSE
jgi:hypothetical protein